MSVLAAVLGVALVVVVLIDGFEVMVLPRRVTRFYRPARLFYRTTWSVWRLAGRWFCTYRYRETFLSVFGPLSLLLLFATWVFSLIVGVALVHWAIGTPMQATGDVGLIEYFYFSGETFFTLGYGDVVPANPLGRVLAVAEAGMGFGFMALIIGYLPVLYQAFSRREVTISLLDARAGSPPSAAEFLLRLGQDKDPASIDPFLAEWERWAAELLESQLSFPVLSYYRSQHDNQSWATALTATLDICALLLTVVKQPNTHQARLTFAMARHAAVDLAMIFRTTPHESGSDRLPPDRFAALVSALREGGYEVHAEPDAEKRLGELRAMYEPFVGALADYFQFRVPEVVPDGGRVDNWQTSAWMRRTPGLGGLAAPRSADDHFD